MPDTYFPCVCNTTVTVSAARGASVYACVCACVCALVRLNDSEVSAGAGHALTVHPETNQIQASRGGKGFTFDKVIPEDADHTCVYDTVRPLVQKFVDGYNATILAYGQVRVCGRSSEH